jgi:hypothetical protein
MSLTFTGVRERQRDEERKNRMSEEKTLTNIYTREGRGGDRKAETLPPHKRRNKTNRTNIRCEYKRSRIIISEEHSSRRTIETQSTGGDSVLTWLVVRNTRTHKHRRGADVLSTYQLMRRNFRPSKGASKYIEVYLLARHSTKTQQLAIRVIILKIKTRTESKQFANTHKKKR